MTRSSVIGAAVLALPLLLGGCEFGYKSSKQTGYRGTGVAQITNTDLRREADAAIPPPPYALSGDGGPPASQTYQNLEVLGDLSTDQFNRLMLSITQWVAPEQGCNYCHDPANMAADTVYTKIVSRRMLQMTRAINTRWSSHVQQTGVTCYTCHRGNNIPTAVWASTPSKRGSILGNNHGQNKPDPNVGYASLPFDPFDSYLRGQVGEIRVAGSSAYPTPGRPGVDIPGIKDAEGSYGLMMHLSSALGVNCTYCHNTQSFRAWGLSSQQRGTAFYGIRMVRDINADYIGPLAGVFPANRLGPMGDPLKVNCTTCHQGQPKPLGGAQMLRDYPELGWPEGTPPAETPQPTIAP